MDFKACAIQQSHIKTENEIREKGSLFTCFILLNSPPKEEEKTNKQKTLAPCVLPTPFPHPQIILI